LSNFPVHQFTRLDIFQQVWKVLEKQGHCDGWGGAECRRIHGDYIKADFPIDVVNFILEGAKIVPINELYTTKEPDKRPS